MLLSRAFADGDLLQCRPGLCAKSKLPHEKTGWSTFAFVIVLLVLGNSLDTLQAQVDTLTELKNEISKLEHSFDGQSVDFLVSIEGTPLPETGIHGTMETSRDGTFRRVSTSWNRLIDGKSYEVRSGYFVSVPDKWGFHAHEQPPDPRSFILGYSRGVYWIHADRSDFRGFLGSPLVANLKGHPLSELIELGEPTVTITNDRISPIQLIITLPERIVVSAFFANDKSLNQLEWKQYFDETESTFRLDGLGPIEYEVTEGKRRISAIPTSYLEGAKSSTGGIKVVSVKPFRKNLGPRIEFNHVDITDGSQVLYFGDEAIRFEIHKGEVVKIADKSALEAAAESKFRNQFSFYRARTFVLGSVLLFVIGFLIWIRIRST